MLPLHLSTAFLSRWRLVVNVSFSSPLVPLALRLLCQLDRHSTEQDKSSRELALATAGRDFHQAGSAIARAVANSRGRYQMRANTESATVVRNARWL